MRIVFIGASTLTVYTAAIMRGRNHDVVIIEKNRDRIDELASVLDCGFIHGDGSKPAILKEAEPKSTDYLFSLTGNDQTNILASLVGRSLGFEHTVTKINDGELQHVCMELGLENIIIPGQTIGRYLADILEGQSPLALSGLIRGEARVLSFVITEEDAVPVAELDLPGDSRVIFLYRDREFIIAGADTGLRAGDEVVIIARDRHVEELRRRWQPGA